MKINGAAVRALRERKSWSQEHLASASGLSVRTVQRVEVDNIASAETRLALAAALDVSVSDLMPAPPPANATVGSRPVATKWSFEGVMRKALLGLGLFMAFAFALLILFNLLSGLAPRS